MTTRRLAAILAADVVGFTSMMEKDEEGTAARVRAVRREVIEPTLSTHQGRLVKTTGDGFLAEFASPVEAVRCALSIQDRVAQQAGPNGGLKLRIGINLGDIIIEDDGDVFGDGVNVAARLEQMADSGGVLISGKIYEEVEGKIDRPFESRGEQQVKNLARPVRVYAVSGSGSVSSRPTPLPLPDKPSIAVLPFTNMGGDPEQEYFTDGLVEDIITALSRFKALFVIARNSSFTYKGRAVDIRQVGRELGVRYVLQGSMRRAAGRVRIAGQLIEAETGHHVWADRFDGELANIFDLQDAITESVVGAIEPSLRVAEIARSRSKPTGNLAAYDLYLRALPHHYRDTEEEVLEALRLLDSAVCIDPQFGLAYAFSASCHAQRIYNNQTADPVAEAKAGQRCARTALERSGNDPEVLWRCAHALAHFGADIQECVSLAERAVALNSNSALALNQSGWVHIYAGNYSLAVERFKRAIRMSPVDPFRFAFTGGLGMAYLMMGEFEHAVPLGRETYSLNPQHPSGLRLLASSLAQIGQLQEALEVVRQIHASNPNVRIRNLSPAIVRSPNSQVFIEGLRKAGYPE